MHDLSPELRDLPEEPALAGLREQALQREQGRLFPVRRELLVAMYAGVAALVAGVGLLVKANLHRIGPLTLLCGIFAAAALCYVVAWRARRLRRQRSLGEDYVLLLGALLFSTAVGFAETQFHVLGAGWSRHLLLLAAWHLATGYFFGSRLVLAVALTAFAAWLGVETRLGTVFDPWHPSFGFGPRALLCAGLFYVGSRFHWREDPRGDAGFREVYLQFAIQFGFWGALGLGANASTRWVGALVLVGLAFLVARAGLAWRRQSFLVFAVGYAAIGLVWLEALVIGDFFLASWVGLFTVIGAVVLLMNLRARLKESAG
jgi:hypothetical protein